jgi:hypothetical protein
MSRTGLTRDNTEAVYSLPRIGRRDIDVSEAYSTMRTNGVHKKLIMTATTGRSGVKWLHEIFKAHRNVAGGSERNPFEESFYRYVKFHELPIDVSGVVDLTKRDIMKDWYECDISVVGSPYLSHDFLDVFSALGADKVIWGINDPRFTVTSFYNKGWYLYEEEYSNTDLACGLQSSNRSKWSRSFSRIVPRGEFYEEWRRLTRVGKIAWFLNTVHMEIWSAVKQLPKGDVWIFRLEEADQDYSYYKKMSESFVLGSILPKEIFLSLKQRASNEEENIERHWSKTERSEFEKYAKDYVGLYRGGELDDPDYMSAVLND